MSKIAIFLSRKITVNRPLQEPISLEPGRNLVDAEIADLPFVKAHTVDAGTVIGLADVDALRARVAELEQLIEQKDADMAALAASIPAPKASKAAKADEA